MFKLICEIFLIVLLLIVLSTVWVSVLICGLFGIYFNAREEHIKRVSGLMPETEEYEESTVLN